LQWLHCLHRESEWVNKKETTAVTTWIQPAHEIQGPYAKRVASLYYSKCTGRSGNCKTLRFTVASQCYVLRKSHNQWWVSLYQELQNISERSYSLHQWSDTPSPWLRKSILLRFSSLKIVLKFQDNSCHHPSRPLIEIDSI
jgi:hypothetical protein